MRSLLHKFAFGIWAFRPEAVPGILPLVEDVVNGNREAFFERKTEWDLMREANLRFVTRDGHTVYAGEGDVEPTQGMVMVMDVKGAIMKEDFCESPGTQTLGRWLQSAETTPEVIGVVLNIDSPGGDGYGMADMAGQIDRMKKPVVSLVNAGMACSAAYGIGCSCDLVLSGTPVDEFGSIGTYVRIRDFSEAEKGRGIKTHTITATRSTEKLADYQEALKADPSNPDDKHYEALRKNYIDPFNEHFVQLVQRNRPGVKDERGVFAGRVFFASEALELGLIDRTGASLTDAIDAVRQLATTANHN